MIVKSIRVVATLVLILALSFPGTVRGQKVETGLEALINENFSSLKGKRVGLITNPTGVDSELRSVIDILHGSEECSLVALYSPEHGIRGEFTAGETVGGSKDPVTGLPVYSLYGKTRKPLPEMLKGIDVLVYDVQDIGSRSYTYISTLGLAMEAAAENGIDFIVLDRPNPLGGIRMEGALTLPAFTSFVSQFPIPYIHGMTVGELALFLNGEKLLKDGIQCRVKVIRMTGWNRDMIWEDTKLPWVPSSPHIPHAVSAYFYPATGIFGELYTASIGVGYTLPFQLFASEWFDADSLSDNLNALNLPGIIFRPIHYKPYYSVSSGKVVNGVQIHLTDPRRRHCHLFSSTLCRKHISCGLAEIFSRCVRSHVSPCSTRYAAPTRYDWYSRRLIQSIQSSVSGMMKYRNSGRGRRGIFCINKYTNSSPPPQPPPPKREK